MISLLNTAQISCEIVQCGRENGKQAIPVFIWYWGWKEKVCPQLEQNEMEYVRVLASDTRHFPGYTPAAKYWVAAWQRSKMRLEIYLTAMKVNLLFLSIIQLRNKTLGKRINKINIFFVTVLKPT